MGPLAFFAHINATIVSPTRLEEELQSASTPLYASKSFTLLLKHQLLLCYSLKLYKKSYFLSDIYEKLCVWFDQICFRVTKKR